VPEVEMFFSGKPLRQTTDFDIAVEAVVHLGLLKDGAAQEIARMLPRTVVEHPFKVATDYRKSGQQLSPDEKRSIGIRTNAFMSRVALSDLTSLGLGRPLEAHAITLLRATFYRQKILSLQNFKRMGCFEVRFSASHKMECKLCQRLDGEVVSIEELAEMPFAGCNREACSAVLMPYKNWFAELR
jgi:hypothetical protein